MTQVLLAVDFEFDLILFELLSDLDDVDVVARPADEIELLALCRTGAADIAIVGEYFPGLDAEVVAQIGATGTKVLGVGADTARSGVSASPPPCRRPPMRPPSPARSTTSPAPPSSLPGRRLRRVGPGPPVGSSPCGGPGRLPDAPSRPSTSAIMRPDAGTARHRRCRHGGRDGGDDAGPDRGVLPPGEPVPTHRGEVAAHRGRGGAARRRPR
ncbi:response regulator transcription factor [Brevibacterium casei]|nr:response regulator transcription factor [Brevibacterium casei]